MVRSFLENWRWAVILVVTAFSLHCGGTPERSVGKGDNNGGGGDGNGDGGEDVVEVCDEWESTSPFEIDSLGPAQISVSAASDGEVLWVGYTRASNLGEGGIQVYGLRIGCDGVPGEPQLLSVSDGDPARGAAAVAVGGDRVLVGWTENHPELSRVVVRYRVLDRAGQPLQDEDTLFEPVIDGVERTGTFSSLALAGGEQGFALAAEMNAPGFPASRVVMQRLSLEGEAQGEALLVDTPVDPRAQHAPAVALEPSGRVQLGWEMGNNEIRRSTLGPVATAFSPRPSAPVLPDIGGQWIAASASKNEEASWFAFSSGTRIVVSDATSYGSPLRVILGEADAAQLVPVVAAGTNGGAAAWLRQSGGRYAVWAQRFVWSGTSLVAGSSLQVSSGAQSGIVRPSITHLSGNTYFVTWREGGGVEGKAMGRIVTFQ